MKKFLSLILAMELFISQAVMATDTPPPGATTPPPATEDCAEEEANATEGSRGIYRIGCDFDESLDNVDSIKPKYLEQIVTSLFAVAMITGLKHEITKASESDCPLNKSSQITVPLAQASALVYVLGDLIANIKFKKLSKDAADATERSQFVNVKTDNLDATAEQIAAYDALINLLEGQKKAVNIKLGLSSVSVAGFTATEGIELGYMIACAVKCGQTTTQQQAKYLPLSTTLTTTSASIQAPANILATYGCSAYSGLATSTAVYYATTYPAQIKAKSIALDSRHRIEGETAKAKIVNFFKDLVMLALPNFLVEKFGMNTAEQEDRQNLMELQQARIQNKTEQDQNRNIARAKIEVLKRAYDTCNDAANIGIPPLLNNQTTAAKGAVEQAAQILLQVLNQTYMQTLSQIEGSNSPSMDPAQLTQMSEDLQASADQLQEQLGNTNTPGGDLALLEIALNQIKGAQSQLASNTSAVTSNTDVADASSPAMEMKILCCGTKGVKDGSPNYRIPTPLPKGSSSLLRDFKLKDAMGSSDINDRSVEWVQRIVENLLYEWKIDEMLERPRVDKTDLASFANMLRPNYVENTLAKKIQLIKGITEKDIAQILKKHYQIQDPELVSVIKDASYSLSDMLMQTAHASPWMDLFQFAGTVLIANMLIGKFVKYKVLNTPRFRAMFWPFFIGLNSIMIHKYRKTKEGVEDRLRIMREEKRKFLASAQVNTQLDDGNEDDGDGMILTAGNVQNAAVLNKTNDFGCASSGTSGINPSRCPGVIANNEFQYPNIDNDVLQFNAPELSNISGLVVANAQSLSTTGNPDSTLGGGNLNRFEAGTNAIRARNTILRDRLSKLQKENQKNSGATENDLHKESMAALQKLSPASNIASLTGAAAISSAGGNDQFGKDNSKGTGKELGAGSTNTGEGVSSGQASATNGGDTLMDDFATKNTTTNNGEDQMPADALLAEKDFKELEVKHNDILKKPEASIFKLLSNRYLINYSKLLEKSKTKDQK